HAHVVVRGRDDELVRLDVLVEDELPRLRTLDPEIFRHVAAREEIADLRPHDVGDPVHDAASCIMHCACAPSPRACGERVVVRGASTSRELAERAPPPPPPPPPAGTIP